MKFLLFILPILISCQDTNEYYFVAQRNIHKYNPPRKDYVIVVDYRKSISSTRLFLIDMKAKKTILECRVSHAFKSGVLYAKDFSNIPFSNKSSCGNFITGETAYGKFGYSMIIDGLDKGINDNARKRSIIFHSNKKMKTIWSLGCFATPEETNKKIIDLTKNGCLICVIN